MSPETEAIIREWSATSEGWCREERALEMAELVIEQKPECIVEIGVFAGGSLIPQAVALKENGAGRIWGIDPWSTKAALEQIFVADDTTPAEEEEIARKWWADVDLNKMFVLAADGIARYDLDRHAILIRCRSEDCYELFPRIDILYIDGNHSEIASCRDVELYLPLLKSKGWLWADDTHWASTQKAVGMIRDQCELIRDHEGYQLYRKTGESERGDFGSMIEDLDEMDPLVLERLGAEVRSTT